jgi:hypothetical protein
MPIPSPSADISGEDDEAIEDIIDGYILLSWKELNRDSKCSSDP